MRGPRRGVARVMILSVHEVGTGPSSDTVLTLHLSPPSLVITSSELSFLMTPFDLKRLESYANNMVDYHVILDLLPCISSLYFDKRLGGDVNVSAVQASILLGMGLQRKSIEDVEVSVITSYCNGDGTDHQCSSIERVVTTRLPGAGVVQQAYTQDQQEIVGYPEGSHRSGHPCCTPVQKHGFSPPRRHRR